MSQITRETLLQKLKNITGPKYNEDVNKMKWALIKLLEINVGIDKDYQDILDEIGDLDIYRDKLENEIMVDFFNNLDNLFEITNFNNWERLKLEARESNDLEVAPIFAILDMKKISILNQNYFNSFDSFLSEFKNYSNKKALKALKKIYDVESEYNNVIRYTRTIISDVFHSNIISDLNKKIEHCKYYEEVNVDLEEALTEFLNNGFGTKVWIDKREEAIKQYNEKTEEFSKEYLIKKGY